ncbi:hypothetical protein KXX50_004671 [Aspergillus fumigatus]|nr:hypothetical protein KXX50_004671 [Aspergillus fumigatus]
MASRPTVTIATADGKPSGATLPLPAVFTAPIRPDIVQQVHTGMAKNKRQPYAVSEKAGEQTSAESWGTGRAVARIPRVSGGGTHRAGQAAFGNQCRSGRMFAPTKVWRKWHQKVNLGQKRFATASALAASSVPSLLFARGHRIANVPEVPLVVESKTFENAAITKTKAAIALLKALGAGADLVKVQNAVVPSSFTTPLVRAFRNIPGVETSSVFSLNLLQLAPGGHLGRFIVWTSAAFEALDQVYGSTTTPAALKKDYVLPQNLVANADLARLINSSEIQSVLRAPKGEARTKRAVVQKKNPLRNKQVMLRLNPYAAAFSKEKLGQKPVESKEKPARPAQEFINTLREE